MKGLILIRLAKTCDGKRKKRNKKYSVFNFIFISFIFINHLIRHRDFFFFFQDISFSQAVAVNLHVVEI